MPDMITPYFSIRYRRKRYRLDITLRNGQRIRHSFDKKSDAESVAYKYKHDEVARRYGLPVSADRPFLSDLVEKRLGSLKGAEKTRSTRVLNDLSSLLPDAICVDEVNKSLIQKYVEKRFRDGLKAHSIDRELNIIAATLNGADLYFPSLEQWRPPRMPRPKIAGGRRERLWAEWEAKAVLDELSAPRRDGEQKQSTLARQKVGKIVLFMFVTGLRTGEMAKIQKQDINWQTRRLRIEQGKTGNVKSVGPLFGPAMDVLKEFSDKSETEFVFFQGKNIPPKFYKTLKRACERTGVVYGRDVQGGLRLYDARHTATTRMLEDGVPAPAVQDWMGWSRGYFVMWYGHTTEKSSAKAGRSMERWAKKIA